jgi:hypothetical protein
MNTVMNHKTRGNSPHDQRISASQVGLTASYTELKLKQKRKAIIVRGRGGPQGCETSRFPHFLDNLLTDGGEVVSLTRRPPFTPRIIPDTHFC